MSRYRKKPVVIDAVQWTPDVDLDDAVVTIARWVREHAPNVDSDPRVVVNINTTDRTLLITTIEGDMTARSGDWIICGVKGELYPCKHEIFEATYEAVGDEKTP